MPSCFRDGYLSNVNIIFQRIVEDTLSGVFCLPISIKLKNNIESLLNILRCISLRNIVLIYIHLNKNL